MKANLLFVCCTACLAAIAQATPIQFTSSEHRISATIPDGWDQVQGVRSDTALKIARVASAGQKARIAVILDAIPAGRVASGYDIWSMSDEDIRKAAGSTSMAGEPVTVLNCGRAAIDGVHVVWSKTRRKAPDGSELWEFTYEGIRGSQYVTIRLTSVGDEGWFTPNQAIFADFIRGLHFK